MIKLYHRKNEIAIESIENISAIDIYYKGKMYGESQLPDDWLLSSSHNRILCLSLGNSTPELLINYIGRINILGGSVVDKSLNTHSINVILEDIDYWENTNSDFNKNSQYWEGLNSEHQVDRTIKYSQIVKNNLISKADEFYFLDGTPYQGDYHQHGDGQAMTGSKHTEDSEFIYRKDRKGNIFHPRKKMNKRQAREILKKYEPIIPSIRSYRKSSVSESKELKKVAKPIATEVKTIKGY